ncbi:hypothetical protein IGI04_042902 [Brassica rapa subsp. trilocularis]|uniref:Retrotransposon gag domain-containing protein n=1 Tax=Brassica rapa subsp. trilocularis TaxID=1813537 RepID=A0ABQ7KH87_BRACM|nr:hypothetical protein IGI04_042902 [Brassica rapa subsp. trilocularis]
MVGETHGHCQMAKENQHLTALQEVDLIAQLRKRKKAQGQRPQPGERRFGDAPEAVYVEPKPPDPSRINQTPTSQTHKHHVVNSQFNYNSFADKNKLFTFSGKRGYLIWERNLDEWFHFNNILKEERLAYAIEQLRDDAFEWWVQEEGDRWFYKEPTINTWRALKEVMRYEFAPKITSSEIQELYPRRYPTHGSKKARKDVPKEGHRSLIHQDQIRPNQKPTVFYDQNQPIEVSKTMEEKKFVSQDTLARHKEKPDKLIFQEKAKVSPILDKFVCKSSPTGMSHLSLSKNDKTGPEVKKDMISKSFLDLKGDVSGTKEHEFKGEDPPGATPVMNQKMEGLNHEANIYGFCTQEEVHSNWNWAKIFTEQDVMNFTTQRFLSRSICEYPTLEGDLSSSKERPEAKPIIGVKRSLSAFQKAQDQEKWPRNYEVMIQSPKPVKPVLHLPQLEANRFNQLQTRHWRPGDHLNQSGDILGIQEEFYKFIPCTSNHWIRRILIYSNLPYLEQTDINVQQLFPLQFRHDLSTFQAFKKVPRKLTYPLKPSRFKKDQILYLEPKSHKRLQRLNVRTSCR